MANAVGSCLAASLYLIGVGVVSAGPTQGPNLILEGPAAAARVAPVPLDQMTPNAIILQMKANALLGNDVEVLHNAARLNGNPAILREIQDAGLLSVERLFHPADVELGRRLGLDRYVRVRVADGTATDQLAEALGSLTDLVENAEVDGRGFHADVNSPTDGGVGPGGMPDAGDIEPPNDIMFPTQYALYNHGQDISGKPGVLNSDVNAVEAWSVTKGSSDTIIALLDSGVSESHPDLAPKLLLLDGRDCYKSDPDADDMTDDSTLSHGTHCAGIAAAVGDNQIGISGMNWNATIMPVRIASPYGWSYESDAAKGIMFAVDNGAHVISISMSYNDGTQALADACRYAYEKDVIVVAAAGNVPAMGVSYPAAHPGVIAVGATNNRDELATFSATGPEVTLVAPGYDILSTWDTWSEPDTYKLQSGTSMATPLVAGVVSLIMDEAPWLCTDEVLDILMSTAKDLGEPGFDELYGHGRVDAGAALAMARGLEPPCYGDITTQGAGVGDPGYGVGDGLTTAADINMFVNLWFVGDLAADMTTQNAPIDDDNYGEPDGLITGADLNYFVNFWIAGCP